MPPSIFRPALRGTRPQIHTHLRISHRMQNHLQTRHNSDVTTVERLDHDPPLQQGNPDPLCILFCGSDDFSCASLTALHALHKARPDLIESIDVLVRPGKRSGRGLKRIAVGPLFHLAHALQLPLHQQDTFTGWDLPLPGRVALAHKPANPTTKPVTVHRHPTSALPCRPPSRFNLLIAVSFGLLVPPRILTTLKYGGLNVHPSLLPDLRGAAPIPRAILAARAHTGVTLQTLHPTKFDHGAVLAQTPAPGIPIAPDATTPSLHALLAPAGAQLLVQGLVDGVHLRAWDDFAPNPAAVGVGHQEVSDAPKITKADLAVDWAHQYWARDSGGVAWTAADLARRWRAVGTERGLWTHVRNVRNPESEKRVIFKDVEAVRCPAALREAVLAVLRAKVGGWGATELGEGEFPGGVGNLVFESQRDMAVEQRSFRLPVYVEAEGGEEESSVVIPVRVPYRIVDGEVQIVEGKPLDAIRVRSIKSEGHPYKDASKALEPFLEGHLRMRDAVGLDYAVDVMARRLD